MKPDPARLADFLAALPRGHDYAVELRNADWYRDDVFALLDGAGASLCLHDLVDAPAPFPPPGPIYYRRFHGPRGACRGRYGRRGLRAAAAEIATLSLAGRPCYAFFNNDLNADAVVDAATLETLVAGALATPSARGRQPLSP
jgi:uncharacterized protein YecE (DUF72 family)